MAASYGVIRSCVCVPRSVLGGMGSFLCLDARWGGVVRDRRGIGIRRENDLLLVVFLGYFFLPFSG